MFDPEIPPGVMTTMREICMAVSTGSHYFVTGTVPASKAQALAQKFHERYALDLTASQRYHRRKRGQVVFSLFLQPLPKSTDFAWWLLATDGEHPLLSMEHWQDARNKRSRLCWPWWYELVKLAMPVKHRQKMQGNKSKPVPAEGWTWRIRADEIHALEKYIRHASQYSDGRLRQLIYNLRRAPGFRGVRNDVKHLYGYIRAQTAKRHKTPPELPGTVSWVRPRKVNREPLSALVRRAQQGCGSWFRQADVAQPVLDKV